VYGFLPRSLELNGGDNAGEVVTAAQRDATVTHLRFLNIFCNFRHDTFAHAVLLLDLVLGRVKVRRAVGAVSTSLETSKSRENGKSLGVNVMDAAAECSMLKNVAIILYY